MIDPRADRPPYLQLADILRDQITSGELAPGQHLLAEPRLGQAHGVSRGTVRRAVAVLRAEGLLVTQAPYGTHVRMREPLERVPTGRGATIRGDMPTPAEVAEYDMPEGVPMLVLYDAGGRLKKRYPAHRYELGAS